ncbi:unnamed protein product [Nezara viridula]|uniref:Uncharacterized protein n=1 Tax=Nezara viridula TaxID=85310 RepID=A0A9P0HC48_NEZVI|nr:unnamed protein product [Nezara viridula]
MVLLASIFSLMVFTSVTTFFLRLLFKIQVSDSYLIMLSTILL